MNGLLFMVMSYDVSQAIATRDAMAKCLYGALFDWIVLQINQALLARKDFPTHRVSLQVHHAWKRTVSNPVALSYNVHGITE